MNLFLIEKYIQRIKKEDINNYALSQGITLKSKELDTLYHYLKTYYKTFLTQKNTRLNLLNELKEQVSPSVAYKLDDLYNQYKNKI